MKQRFLNYLINDYVHMLDLQNIVSLIFKDMDQSFTPCPLFKVAFFYIAS